MSNTRRFSLLAVCLVLSAALPLDATEAPAAKRFSVDDLEKIVRLSSPRISPDGTSIAVVVTRADVGKNKWIPELDVVDVATGAMRVLSRDRKGDRPPALVAVRRPPRLPRARGRREEGEGTDLRPPDGGRRGAESDDRAERRPALRVAARRKGLRVRGRGRTPEQGGDREGQRPLRGRKRQPFRVRGPDAGPRLARAGRGRRGEAADVGRLEPPRGPSAQPAVVAALVVAGRQAPRVHPRRDASLGGQRCSPRSGSSTSRPARSAP